MHAHTDAMKQALAAVTDMQLPAHIARYARESRYDAVLGTLQLVDKAARQRGFAAVRNFGVISLSRVMRNEESFRRDGKRTLEMEFFVNGLDASVGVYSEHMGIDQHGLVNTHMEAINHMLWEGTTYGGHKLGTPEADKTDILAWAERGWVTHGILADILLVRGTDYVTFEDPVVTGDEIEAAVKAAGITPQPGDALLLYMGEPALEGVGRATGGRDGAGPGGATTR